MHNLITLYIELPYLDLRGICAPSLYLIMTLHFNFVFQKCDDDGAFKKGLLWQQRDKLFSRWKERYFFLTKDYFHCFKKASSRITEMGGFIFKVIHENMFSFLFFIRILRPSVKNPFRFLRKRVFYELF